MHEIVMAEGFELTQRGHSWRGLCPLHDRDGRNPSFVAWDTHFKCFSCHESGDGPAFIMKLKGFNYPQALQYLGEEVKQPTRQEQAKWTRERTERAEARWRESDLAWTLGTMIRRCNKALEHITPDTLDSYALILTELETLKYQHDIMINGDPATRAELVRELAGLRLFSRRTLLFRRDFDCAEWARSLYRNQEPRNEPGSKPEAGYVVGN
jgi:hypothetical protein